MKREIRGPRMLVEASGARDGASVEVATYWGLLKESKKLKIKIGKYCLTGVGQRILAPAPGQAKKMSLLAPTAVMKALSAPPYQLSGVQMRCKSHKTNQAFIFQGKLALTQSAISLVKEAANTNRLSRSPEPAAVKTQVLDAKVPKKLPTPAKIAAPVLAQEFVVSVARVPEPVAAPLPVPVHATEPASLSGPPIEALAAPVLPLIAASGVKTVTPSKRKTTSKEKLDLELERVRQFQASGMDCTVKLLFVIAYLGKSRSTIYRLMKKGQFPQADKLAGATVWNLSDIEKYKSGHQTVEAKQDAGTIQKTSKKADPA